MMSKTHIAVGVATSLAILQPRTLGEYCLAVIGGAVGGMLPDIDIADNDAGTGRFIALGITVVLLVTDYFFDFGICEYLLTNKIQLIVGGLLFAALYVVGVLQPHRAFTHSLLGLVVYSVPVTMIYPSLTAAFALGFASHIATDLLNKRGVRLFFPLKRGFSFGLCYANKLANSIFLYLGMTVSTLLLLNGILYHFFRIV